MELLPLLPLVQLGLSRSWSQRRERAQPWGLKGWGGQATGKAVIKAAREVEGTGWGEG